MTCVIRRLGSAMTVVVVALLTLPALTASAVETPAPEGAQASVQPSSATLGERATVVTRGWAPGTQLQAVLCGQMAIGGSKSCHLPTAVTAASDADGEARHVVTVKKPPVPCPCVVRVTTFTAPAQAMNVPIEVRGHAYEKVVVEKEAQVSTDLRVESVDLTGRGGLSSLMGLGGSTTMTVTLANRGANDVPAPAVAYGFGRGDVDTEREMAPGVTVPAGGKAEFEVELDFPLLAFGEHTAVAQWADGTGNVRSDSVGVFPAGALLLLLAGLVGVIVTDVRRAGLGRLEELMTTTPGAHRFVDDDGSYPLPEVVYLEDIGGYLVKPALLKNSRVASKLGGRVSVDDLAKLVEGRGKALYPNGEPASSPLGAGGLSQFVRGELLRRGPRDGSGSVGSGPGLNFFVRGERHRDDRNAGAGPGLNFFVKPERHREGEGPSSHKGSGPGLNFFVRPERHRDDEQRPKGSGPGLNFLVRNDRDRDL